MPMEVLWVRIYGYSLFMNDKSEYEKKFNPFGAYALEIDTVTK